MFINKLFNAERIRAMHHTLQRLTEYAIEATANSAKPVRTFSDLADALDESPQTINNWKDRGVSKSGALKAEAKFGCASSWVMTGRDATKRPAVQPNDPKTGSPKTIEQRVTELLADEQMAAALAARLVDGARAAPLPRDVIEFALELTPIGPIERVAVLGALRNAAVEARTKWAGAHRANAHIAEKPKKPLRPKR